MKKIKYRSQNFVIYRSRNRLHPEIQTKNIKKKENKGKREQMLFYVKAIVTFIFLNVKISIKL